MSDDSDPGREPVRDVSGSSGKPSPIRALPGPSSSLSRPALAPPSATFEDPPEPRTPVADVVRTLEHLYVTVEIPDAIRERIDVMTKERGLTVHAIRPEGPAYHLEFELPDWIDPSTARATYLNGVLDITLTRAGASRPGER